jgi:hypothetical protein
MKRFILIAFIAFTLVACDLPAPTATPTPTEPGEATDTPTVTLSPSPSPTATATATPTATGTPHEPVLGPNLLDNPSFEGAYRPVVYGEVNVAPGWYPFYCDGCPPLKPDQSVMGRPEYKPEDVYNYPDRVHGGELAQVWFSFFRPAQAGVYQVVEILPGFTYQFSIWVQSWSSFDDDPESELDTEDQRNASQWAIRIDPLGGTDPHAAAMFVCELDGIEHYDSWVEFACEFESQSSRVTVFVENTRPWGLRNQNSYVDDAYLGCYDCPDTPFYTPTPIVPQTPGPSPTPTNTPTPSPTPERVLDEHILIFGPDAVYWSEDYSMTLRSTYSVNGSVMGGLAVGEATLAVGRWIGDNGDRWACVDDAAQIIPNPDYDWLLVLDCHKWVAMSIGNTIYGDVHDID